MSRLIILVLIIVSCNSKALVVKSVDSVVDQARIKKLSVLDYEQLTWIKAHLNSKEYLSLYKDLLKKANQALKEGPYTVMQKTQTPPSGDKHDYISLGPYWWPDPDQPDGLPWIRKDGEVNPLTREGSTDYETKNEIFDHTASLAMAYFFSEEQKYADKALELLQVWFLNEATKMNPNLNFAQGIPGINTGRGIGIIEFAGITNIISAIEILELEKAMDQETSKKLRLWFSDYLLWLQTSENGIFEKNTKNNHATWYDVQIVSMLMFLDRISEAKQILEEVKTARIATQIGPDGAQPHELARTKTLSYSTMNLRGFTQLAFLGKKANVDLWNYQADNGASIAKAYEFLKPYASGEKEWSWQQISSLSKAHNSLSQLFERAGSQFNIPEYCQIGSRNSQKASSLLYSCQILKLKIEH